MFGVVDCYNHEVEFSKQSVGVSELLKNKAHRKHWSSQANVLTINAGTLAGVHPNFSSACCVNKSPFTNEVCFSEFPGFGESLARAGLSGLRFERKSEKPVILFLDGEKISFLELGNGFVKSLHDKGHNALKYFISKNFGGSVLTTSSGSNTVFGNVKEKSFTNSGGVGSVLRQAHGVVGVVLSQKNGLNYLDESLVSGLSDGFVFQENFLSDSSLLFNKKYDALPNRLFWNFKNKDLGLKLGIFDEFLVDKLFDEISVKGFDVELVSNLISGFLHAVHAGHVFREDFVSDFDVCFDFREFNSNPVFYSNEHYNFSRGVLSLLFDNLNLSRSQLFSYLKNNYGKESVNFFKLGSSVDLAKAISGFNGGAWNIDFTGKICALNSGKSINFGKEAVELSKIVNKFNGLNKVFGKVLEH
ncbi:MAG: hypothetical protein GON13_02175 [Nanoarchaeota archaeon]|nr:hypothetical protein [Nanoarchaeota archaeon]